MKKSIIWGNYLSLKEGCEFPKTAKQLLEAMNKSRADIEEKKWLWFSDILPSIKEWKSEKLYLRKNQTFNIFKEIKEISFPDLTLLALQENEICSLQILSRIWMPSLDSLGLENNNLMSIKAMRKARFINLSKLGIAQNYVMNCEEVVKFPTKNLQMISLEIMGLRQQSPDISWIGKHSSNNISSVYLRSSLRIMNKSKRILEVLNKKYWNLDGRLFNAGDDQMFRFRIY